MASSLMYTGSLLQKLLEISCLCEWDQSGSATNLSLARKKMTFSSVKFLRRQIRIIDVGDMVYVLQPYTYITSLRRRESEIPGMIYRALDCGEFSMCQTLRARMAG